MDKPYFKSSADIGIAKDDAAFMNRFNSNLQLEPTPQLRKSRSQFLTESLVFAAAAALLLSIFWSYAVYFIAPTVLLIAAGLAIAVFSEVGSDFLGELNKTF